MFLGVVSESIGGFFLPFNGCFFKSLWAVVCAALDGYLINYSADFTNLPHHHLVQL